MALAAGTRFGPYSISGMLGAGGMGEVYRAHDARLNRDVAVKVLPASVAADAGRMARFQREAQLLASLSHPHIAAVYGLEESAGSTALVMELVEGPNLSERIAQGPIPLEEALALARQIGEALEAAHEKGIVHRDLKPANIKLTADGQVKVLDFGLAKALAAETVAGGDLTNSPTLTLEGTRAGMIMGTAGYMSPEQARGKPVDKRADIWAFGVVVLEMLTGKSIFEGETVSDTLAAVLRADVDWKSLPAGTPPKVLRLLQRCLERDPKRRLRDIGDAWMEFDVAGETPAPRAAPASPSRLPWIAAAVLGGAGIAWGLLHRPNEPARVPIHSIVSEKGIFVLPAVSHDGRQFAATAARGNALSLAARQLDENQLKTVPGSDGMFYPEFSPDGQWIAAFTGATAGDWAAWKISRNGGTAFKLSAASQPLGLTWGDDDTIVCACGQGLIAFSSSGGTSRTLLRPDTAKGETEFATPHFMPGSRVLVFTISNGKSNQIAVLNMETKRYRVVVENARDGRYVLSGYLLYARGETVYAAPFDARTLAVTGQDAPVIENVAVNGPSGALAEYAVSDNGLLVYSEGRTGIGKVTTLGWLDRNGKTETASDSQAWGTGRLSPDGRRVANELYAATIGEGQPGDIWTLDLERRTKTRLTFSGINSWPIWSSDGRRITYSSLVDGQHGISTVMADGSSQPQLLLATGTLAVPDSWSPDGTSLCYHQAIGAKRQLWVLPVANGVAGKPLLLHESSADESDGQISPDGHWIAYISAETGRNEAYVQPFPGHGGKEIISTQGADSVRWSHDGRQLFYLNRTGQGALMAVDMQTKPTLHIGMPVQWANVLFGTTWDPAPDGKRLLVEIIAGLNDENRVVRGVSDWFEELRRRVPVRH